ncbi:methyltransferase [Candidatus Woesebacteria bacterium RBG_16_36_11]|uniref:Methyltransferase n=1 Tax=Candidatus Woesebacteria bacterium RBG_16_36_11 TaxID=1802481 RepID=A0A1F7X6R5_9BACT|nr:MAG: methyltransferase [Candidatus Woesebacteria bacterium RBG_16_36_11]
MKYKVYKKISKCRICGNSNLKRVINLGRMGLTGIFPSQTSKILTGPLEVVKCVKSGPDKVCGLVQLRHSYNQKIIYGKNYGYRSGLNRSMIDHLHELVENLSKYVSYKDSDMIIDIGSNDGTMLNFFPKNKKLKLVGIDPTAKKFKKYYSPTIKVIPEIFSVTAIKKYFGNKKTKVVATIAMFYDLENPLAFAQEVEEILLDDGIWVMEQSYLPLMIKVNAYDTICHEHLEYYRLKQIKWICDNVGLKIIDIETNDTNGGSFKLILAKKESKLKENHTKINNLLKKEISEKIDQMQTYKNFRKDIIKHKRGLRKIINKLEKENKKIFGYGASTKGNVMLQYCGITAEKIPLIAEVNEDKFGHFTPCTNIPIIDEKKAHELKPDYFLVLPWHFKNNIIAKEKNFLKKGGHLIFPLPKIEII